MSWRLEAETSILSHKIPPVGIWEPEYQSQTKQPFPAFDPLQFNLRRGCQAPDKEFKTITNQPGKQKPNEATHQSHSNPCKADWKRKVLTVHLKVGLVRTRFSSQGREFCNWGAIPGKSPFCIPISHALDGDGTWSKVMHWRLQHAILEIPESQRLEGMRALLP